LEINNYLILIKGKDSTEQIEKIYKNNGKWEVKYFKNNKVYKYNYDNVRTYTNPKIISPESCLVFKKDQPITGIVNILDFGHYIKLIFKSGYKEIYPRSTIFIEESCLSNVNSQNCFLYLRKLADNISIKFEDDTSFLAKQYNSIETISPRSVLSIYLEGKSLNKEHNLQQPIFPFGFNLSQKDATEKALTEQVSIIEGPPGTGKTQTILNIISNAIINNKTVAVVSNNNSATANVFEKLQKYEVDFIAAYLGNNENKEKFFFEQKNTYPTNMSEWSILPSDYRMIKDKLKTSQQKLSEMLSYKNKQAKLKLELSKLETEQEYFNQYYTASNIKPLKMSSFSRISSDRIMKILVNYELQIQQSNISLINKIYNLFVYGVNFKLYKNTPEVVIPFLQKTYFDKKINELKSQIESLNQKLKDYNFDVAMQEYSQLSMDLFKSKLLEKYNIGEKRRVFKRDDLWKNSFEDYIKEYPVILSTTHSLRTCAKQNYLYDYVIIDEASQVDIVTGALALSCAKNAVIVGDLKQLPNVVPAAIAYNTNRIFESFNLNEAYRFSNQSILSSLSALYSDIPKTLLKEHYRCHPKIIEFCNQKFYNNELIILTNEQTADKPIALYKTAKGNHARGKFNQRQIDVIFEEILPNKRAERTNESIGIISPYRMQANMLQQAIGEENFEADTVHKYQGRERDIIILTTVANEIKKYDFVDSPNLINVAVSRAVHKLIVVVSEGAEDWKGTNIGDLISYIQYNNFEIIESEIYSVFDLLYSSYSDKLLEIMKRSKKVSIYKSENLMNTVIEKVLNLPEFQTLDRVLHQPLRMLLKDMSKLSDDEREYAMNILTHTDFVIFNTIDKKPILVVEVDGHAFHANNPAQIKRDKMKDEILQKYNIPILRMKTTDSGEERKLRGKLTELLR